MSPPSTIAPPEAWLDALQTAEAHWALHFVAPDTYHRSTFVPASDGMVVITGGLHFCLDADGETMEAGPGDVVLYRVGQNWTTWNDPKAPTDCLLILFSAPTLPLRGPAGATDSAGRMTLIARWLLDARDLDEVGSRELRNAYLRALLAEFVRVSGSPDPPMVNQFRAYIAAHSAEPLTLQQIATALGYSQYHFCRRYKALTGRSPMADLQRHRMEQARRLVGATDLPLKAIAARVGLRHASHLSRLFREQFGLSPHRLRRSAGLGGGELRAPN